MSGFVARSRYSQLPGAAFPQRPAPPGITAMFVIAISFIASTTGLLIATALEAWRHQFGRRFGGRP
jgi:hypothetical protein